MSSDRNPTAIKPIGALVAPAPFEDLRLSEPIRVPLLNISGSYDCDVGARNLYAYRLATSSKAAVTLDALGHNLFNTYRDSEIDETSCGVPASSVEQFQQRLSYEYALRAYTLAFLSDRGFAAATPMYRDLFTGSASAPSSMIEHFHEFRDAYPIAHLTITDFDGTEATGLTIPAPVGILECERPVACAVTSGFCMSTVWTVSWDAAATYSLSFSSVDATSFDVLQFRAFQNVCDPTRNPTSTRKDLVVRLSTGAGPTMQSAELSLSELDRVLPPWKPDFVTGGFASFEANVSRVIRIPLEAYLLKNPLLDLSNVTSINFVFGTGGDTPGIVRTTGTIGIDEVEFSR